MEHAYAPASRRCWRRCGNPSLAQRLSQVVADAEAARLDQALLLARATYENVLYSAAGGLESPAASSSQGLLDDAEQQAAAVLEELDVDGRAAVDEAMDAARSDISAALSSENQPPGGFVMVGVAELQETNRLLRELLAKKPAPDQVVRWATLVLVVVGILAVLVALHAPATPPARSAPITQSVRPRPPVERSAKPHNASPASSDHDHDHDHDAGHSAHAVLAVGRAP